MAKLKGLVVFIFFTQLGCQHFQANKSVGRPTSTPLYCQTEHKLPSMGTFFEMQLVHRCDWDPQPMVIQAQTVLNEIESDLSLYQSESEVSRLNRDGKLCTTSSHLLRLLDVSRDYYKKTQGAFDITILPVLREIERSFKEAHRPPRHLEKFRPQIGMDKVERQDNCIELREKGMGLTFDGIAKGYAVDEVVKKVPPEVSGYLLNFSGNMLWRGQKLSEPWQIAVWNPVKQEIVRLPASSQGAIATSGPESAHFDDRWLWHHLIDPKTLRSPRYYVSVSVVGRSAMECDVLSTTFSVVDKKVLRKIKYNLEDGFKVLIFDQKGHLKEY